MHVVRRFPLLAVLLAALTLLFVSVDSTRVTRADDADANRFVIVDDTSPPVPIYVGPKGSIDRWHDAKELARYLRAITGQSFRPTPAPDEIPERAIVLGPVPYSGFELPDDLGGEGYVVRKIGGCVQLAGLHAAGTRHAIFDFLQDEVGCGLFAHDEERIPDVTYLVVTVKPRVERPAFAYRELYNREADLGNIKSAQRRHKPFRFLGGHNLYELVADYGKTHPEIYPADDKGVRKPNKLHLCYTNPALPNVIADALSKEITRRKGNVEDFVYVAGMGDWYGGVCQCDRCRGVYSVETWTDPAGQEKPGTSATLIRMVNNAATLLEERHPGARMATLAYLSLEAPPATVRPRHNVLILVPRLRRCSFHTVGTCPDNESYLHNLRRWCEIEGGGTYVWDYGIAFHSFFLPLPCVRAIAGNLALYRDLGVEGVRVQGNYVSTGGHLTVLKNHVWSELLWNPDQDVDAVTEAFCLRYGGPAGAQLYEYVRLLEDAVADVDGPNHAHGFQTAKEMRDSWLSDELLAKLRDARKRGLEAAAGQDPYERRVKEMTCAVEAIALWFPGPLEEQGDKLVRTDIGEYTMPRVLDLIAHSRNASLREWGRERAYQLNLQQWHGGPLVRLSNEPLEVTIAPTIRGHVRQITYDGRPLLHVAQFGEDGYPLVGGSFANVSGDRVYDIVGDPTPSSVRLQADAGIGMWSPGTQAVVTLDVALRSPRVIEMAARAEPEGKRGWKSTKATVKTTYLADPNGLRVEVAAGSDAGAGRSWTAVELSQESIHTSTAVRIRLPDGFIVIDEYRGAQPVQITIQRQASKKLLHITVHTADVSLSSGAKNRYLDRQITLVPPDDESDR